MYLHTAFWSNIKLYLPQCPRRVNNMLQTSSGCPFNQLGTAKTWVQYTNSSRYTTFIHLSIRILNVNRTRSPRKVNCTDPTWFEKCWIFSWGSFDLCMLLAILQILLTMEFHLNKSFPMESGFWISTGNPVFGSQRLQFAWRSQIRFNSYFLIFYSQSDSITHRSLKALQNFTIYGVTSCTAN